MIEKRTIFFFVGSLLIGGAILYLIYVSNGWGMKQVLEDGCMITGCSGTGCTETEEFQQQPYTTSCEWKSEYACFRTARCERQSDGRCGWTKTLQLQTCQMIRSFLRN